MPETAPFLKSALRSGHRVGFLTWVLSRARHLLLISVMVVIDVSRLPELSQSVKESVRNHWSENQVSHVSCPKDNDGKKV